MTGHRYRLSLPGKRIDFNELTDEAAVQSSLIRLRRDREERPAEYAGLYTISVWRVRENYDGTESLRILASFGTFDR